MFIDQNGAVVPGSKAQGQKNDPAATAGVGPYGHGAGGLFNIPETNDGVFSAFIQPMGALAKIPVLTSDPFGPPDVGSEFGGYDAEFDSLITGVTEGALEDFANQPTAECDDYPVGGLMKVCTTVNTRGRFGAGIRPLNLERAGQRESRVDPNWLRVINQSPGLQGLFDVPGNTPSLGGTLVNELSRRMYETAVSFNRMFAPRVWTGTPANNSGQRRDIVGLDVHINTGNKVDYRTSAVCTAANSVVRDFAFNDVDAADRYLIEQIEDAEYNAVEWNGGRMGLGQISGLIFMRPELWRRVAAIWPVQRVFDGLREMENFSSGRIMLDGNALVSARDELRNNPKMVINGRTYEVCLDDTMPQDTPNTRSELSPGQYSSDIVFVPMTVMGGAQVTFWNYFRQNNANSEAIASIPGGGFTFTTDNGLFRWYVNFRNGCLEMNFKFQPQLKLKTPMVAWRLNNVAVTPVSHPRDWDPNSDYFANGGNTNSPVENQYYSSWSPTTPASI
jgi:hypothetical protein